MALYDQITQEMELRRQRELRYRTRFAWGNNHLRRLDNGGSLMRTVSARSSESGHAVDSAIDGFRPHETPLDAAYEGYWQSTGRPMLKLDPVFIDSCNGTPAASIDGRSPDLYNTTYDTWHDPDGIFAIDATGQYFVNNGDSRSTSYIDFGMIEFDLTFQHYIGNAGSHYAGWIFRMKDENNNVCLFIDSAGTVNLRARKNGGAYSVIASAAYALTIGWKTVRIINTKNRIRVFVEGAQYIDYYGSLFGTETKMSPHWGAGASPIYWDAISCYSPINGYEQFDDWAAWTLNSYGTPGSVGESISTEWGLLTGTTGGIGNDGGYTAMSNAGNLIKRDGFFQFQLGSNKPSLSNASNAYVSWILSHTNVSDPATETNALLVSIHTDPSGSEILVEKIVSGVRSTIDSQALESSDYVCSFKVFIHNYYAYVYENKYGLIATYNFGYFDLPYDVYLKLNIHMDEDALNPEVFTIKGYFRDVAVFWKRSLYVSGEVGHYDDFSVFDDEAWYLYDPVNVDVTHSTPGGEDALYLYETAGGWGAVTFDGVNKYGDFVLETDMQKLSATSCAVLFRLQDNWLDSTKGYGVVFENTQAVLFKDLQAGGGSRTTTIATNATCSTAQNDRFDVKIACEGDSIKVWKDNTLIFDETDSDYSEGFVGFQGYNGTLVYVFELRISERGLQRPVTMFARTPLVQNPSFEDWDNDDGVVEAPTEYASNWAAAVESNCTGSKGVGYDGNNCQVLTITDPRTQTFSHAIYQKNFRLLDGHRYRISCKIKYEYVAPHTSLNGSAKFSAVMYTGDPSWTSRKQSLTLSTINEDLIESGEWIDFEMSFWSQYTSDEAWFVLGVEADSTTVPENSFSLYIDHVMLEDVTNNAGVIADAEWSETPVGYIGLEADRIFTHDWFKTFFNMPFNRIYRSDDDFMWGFLDEDREPLFTSRVHDGDIPGKEWRVEPEWFEIDLGMILDTNQIVHYPLWSAGTRWFIGTYGDSSFVEHTVVKLIAGGKTDQESQTRFDIEMEESVSARYLQWVVLDSDEDDDVATAQQVELYNFSDESAKVVQQQGSGSQVMVTQSRTDGVNSLPNAAQISMSLNNQDNRYTPRNKFSPLFNYAQLDGLGDIRSNIPMSVSMLMTDIEEQDGYDYVIQEEGYTKDVFINADPDYMPGWLRLYKPALGSYPYQMNANYYMFDVDSFPNVSIKIDDIVNSGDSSLVWGLSVYSATEDETVWLKAYSDDLGEFTFDIPDVTGWSGVQKLRFQVMLDIIGADPGFLQTWIELDHFRVYSDALEDIETTYETLMFLGTIGNDKNRGGALGISINSSTKVCCIDGVDSTVLMDEPTPVDEIDVWTSITPEETMRRLCYVANIPRQDTDFDATGLTFPVVILREQTIREQLKQITDVLGGKFYVTPDGVCVYRNVAAPRSWTQTEKADFEAGSTSDVDTTSVEGEVSIGNVVWEYNDNFDVLPENEDDPWTVDNADSHRFISGGEYFVITPAGSATKMQHVKQKAFDKSTGFTIEFDVGLEAAAPSYEPVLDVWGYTDDIVVHGTDEDYYNPSCAWRVELFRYQEDLNSYRLRIGGQTNAAGYPAPVLWTNYGSSDQERCRMRLVFKNNQYKVYMNEFLIGTYDLCYPGQIRWGFPESASYYEDSFSAVGDTDLDSWAGWEENDTRDTWHDASNIFKVRSAGYVNLQGVDNGSSYIDFGCPDFTLTCKQYLDRTISWGMKQGFRVKYYDVNNCLRVELWSSASPYDPSMIHAYVRLVERIGGVDNYVAYGEGIHCYEGSHGLEINVSANVVQVYFTPYMGGAGMGTRTRVIAWIGSGSAQWMGWNKLGFYADAGSPTSWDDLEITRGSSWLEPVSEDFVGKVVIGPDACEVAIQDDPAEYAEWSGLGGNYRTAYRMDYFRIYLSGNEDPITAVSNLIFGDIESQSHDCSADISGWGIFEAELRGIGGPVIGGTMQFYSSVTFYIAVSDDDISYDDWVEVVPGEAIPSTVAAKRYVKWKARLWKRGDGWNYWRTPKIRSVVVNFLIETSEEITAMRATYDLAADTSTSVAGVELSDANYSMGNPIANRVTAMINRWVQQSITDYTVTGIAFWESQDLPQVIDNGEIYEVYAEYSNPSEKGSGGTLRHLNATINAVPFTINDGSVDQVCGNTKITFISGQRVGYIKVEATANGQSIDILAIDAVGYLPASDLYGTERSIAEDTDLQAVMKRVIESDLIDNAFAMSRTIGQYLADAKLTHDKYHSERIESIVMPVIPGMTLDKIIVVNAPDVGCYERQISLFEVVHDGFKTSISGEGIRTE